MGRIKVGDVVLLREDGTACALWKLAKVVESTEGRDGLVQFSIVQLLSKEKLAKLCRPIQHLIPLEVS